MSTDLPESVTHPLIQEANKGLADFEKLLEDARDVLFNLSQDITNNVPDSQAKQDTIFRINLLRNKL